MSNELQPTVEGQQPDPTAEELAVIEKYRNSIDFSQPDQVVVYGAAAQNRMTTFADSVLNNVRDKDMGEVGGLLSNLVSGIRTFDRAASTRKGIAKWFDSIKKQIRRLQAEYSKVETNIGKITAQLESHSQALSKDIFVFNEQYKENAEYFKNISLYIVAGEEKIKEMREKVLPELIAKVSGGTSQMEVQQYNDLEHQVTRFEKKVHDLRLSRVISVQLAPQIRLVQNNSATMVDKIQSTLVHTIPLWKSQMVLALGIAHTRQALDMQKAVTDTTNDLLRKNSQLLKESTVEIAAESERGIVDLETIKQANSDLFQALDDLLRIQSEGRQKRLAAEVEIKGIENELKNRLLSGKQQA